MKVYVLVRWNPEGLEAPMQYLKRMEPETVWTIEPREAMEVESLREARGMRLMLPVKNHAGEMSLPYVSSRERVGASPERVYAALEARQLA